MHNIDIHGDKFRSALVVRCHTGLGTEDRIWQTLTPQNVCFFFHLTPGRMMCFLEISAAAAHLYSTQQQVGISLQLVDGRVQVEWGDS